MSKKKSVWRWFGEALLVFTSVLGAFWVEDYRHNKQEKEDFINTLVNLRNDVHNNVREMRYTYDTASYIFPNNRQGPRMGEHNETFELLTASISDPPKVNSAETINLFRSVVYSQLVDWRVRSPFAEHISSYPKYLNKDSLAYLVSKYRYIMRVQFGSHANFNEVAKELLSHFEKNIEFRSGYDDGNSQFLSSTYFFNKVIYLRESHYSRITGDSLNAVELSKLCLSLDKVLIQYDVDTSSLDKQFLYLE